MLVTLSEILLKSEQGNYAVIAPGQNRKGLIKHCKGVFAYRADIYASHEFIILHEGLNKNPSGEKRVIFAET